MVALRVLFLAVALVTAGVSVGLTALGSCIQQTVAEQAERADAVVYARVSGFEGAPGGPPGRFAFVQVERVLKGSTYARIGVGVGPGSEGGGISGPAATSIDYQMERGTDHTLYLKQTAPAGFTTDACSGSHPGPPTAEEERLFGPGGPPDRDPTGVDGATDADRAIAAAATLIALAAGAGAIVYAQRAARRTASL